MPGFYIIAQWSPRQEHNLWKKTALDSTTCQKLLVFLFLFIEHCYDEAGTPTSHSFLPAFPSFCHPVVFTDLLMIFWVGQMPLVSLITLLNNYGDQITWTHLSLGTECPHQARTCCRFSQPVSWWVPFGKLNHGHDFYRARSLCSALLFTERCTCQRCILQFSWALSRR